MSIKILIPNITQIMLVQLQHPVNRNFVGICCYANFNIYHN